MKQIFEPYAAKAMPSVLSKIGDKVPEVRAAAEAASSAIVSIVSLHGLVVFLPIMVSTLPNFL